MEPNTNEATAPKRLKTGGKKPIIIIGVIVAVLLAAYVGLCAYANSLDIFYPNTTINGVDVAGLTAEQAAERLRQEIPEETVEFYLPLADETGDGESAPEGDMLYGADPDAVCTYRELGITEELDYEVSAQSAFDAVQGRSSFFVKGWEYLACLVGADGQLGVVLEPEEDIFQVKMEQLSEQFSREAQDASYEVTEDAVEITKALNGTVRVRRRSCADCTGKMDWQRQWRSGQRVCEQRSDPSRQDPHRPGDLRRLLRRGEERLL